MRTKAPAHAAHFHKVRDEHDRLEAHARKLARLRRSRASSVAIVASDRRIPALRLLLSATLALALVLHWLR